MANIKSQIKRNKQNEKRRMQNKILKSKIKTGIKRYKEAMIKNEKELINETKNKVISLISQSVSKKVYKKNKASRLKSQIMKYKIEPKKLLN